ncbi:MAG: pilin [Spiribacter salinus]|uniref:Pilin n=1 Tax=Spiribacter salinus TaxID=1335746 RepID=A0A540VIZ7_9GAMM|nr:MAG: pilin [Spiribacter salinus]
MRKQSGFTLIELMIVVAILAILMAIAIPAYQDYTIRSQVSEGMNLAGGVRTAVAEYWVDKGSFPTDNTEAGVAASGDITGEYVTDVAVGSGGTITVEFGNEANSAISGNTLELDPSATTSGGSISWQCDGGDVDPKYRPARCR